MDSKFLVIAIVFAVLVAVALVFLFLRQRKEIKSTGHAPLTGSAGGNAGGHPGGNSGGHPGGNSGGYPGGHPGGAASGIPGGTTGANAGNYTGGSVGGNAVNYTGGSVSGNAGGNSGGNPGGTAGGNVGSFTIGAADGTPGAISSRQMQLMAYERLILLADRIALPNLIARVNTPGLAARDMQSLLTHSIRQEFEHNITQQIYVSAEAWGVIRDYKEQNLMIVNQVASFLPEEATGTDLNRALLDVLVQNPKASLQDVVSEALSYEAKKLM